MIEVVGLGKLQLSDGVIESIELLDHQSIDLNVGILQLGNKLSVQCNDRVHLHQVMQKLYTEKAKR